MTGRTTARLAWGLAAFALAATSIELWLLFISPEGLPLNHPERSAAIDYLEFFFFVIVGALVAWKRPFNRVGWLMLAYVVLRSVVGITVAYGERGVLIDPGSLPGASAVVWFATWLWSASLVLIPLVLLYFPNGRLPSPRWRWVIWCCVLPVMLFVSAAIGWAGVPAQELLTSFDEGTPGPDWSGALTNGGVAVLLGLGLCSVVSLFIRYRRSSHEERLQLKWVLFAAGLLLADSIWESFLPGPDYLQAAVGALAFAAIPAAIGVAILKYRLYEIDRIINRALVYGLLTATLGIGYLVIVVALQRVLDPFTQANEIAIAGSTLLVAALFQPVRSRIQNFIDRRFYRSRYDATRTLEGFSTRLREGVDLEVLTADLTAVVGRTMGPAHISVWLRGSKDGS
ncbi:MAG: hypothetical protein ACRDJV_10150 [Actinomycetota bacterium]